MKVVFCVFGCATKLIYKKQILKVLQTWGSKAKEHNFEVIFFLGEEKTDLVGKDYIYLDGVANDYYSASIKQNLGLKYIHDNCVYDFVFVLGTDTYVNIEILIKYLKTQNPDDNICIGGHGAVSVVDETDVFYLSGGAGIILSRKSLSHISPFLTTMFESWKKLKIEEKYISACDLCISYYLHKCDCVFIEENSLFYNCNYKDNTCHKGVKLDAITCHNMTLNDFDTYTYLIQKKSNISKMKLCFTSKHST
jgi:hypothetical protein